MSDEDEELVEVRSLVADLPNWTIYRHFYGETPEPGTADCMSNFSYPRELEGDKERQRLVDGTSVWYDTDDYYTLEHLFIEIEPAVWGDYSGSCFARANHQAILEEYPQYVVDVSGGYNSHSLYLPLTAKIPQAFADGLLGLLDHAIWDEGVWSDVEMKLQEECWDEYQRAEFRKATRDAIEPYEDVDFMIDAMGGDDFLDEFYFAFLERENLYPECESATTAIFPDWERAAKECADAIIAAYMKPADQPEGQEVLV